ncbi:MAG: polysaccharide biosynthesis tyrosine autokinase [Crocinitomicaceae bacterium]
MATPKLTENKQKLFETKDLVFVWRLLLKNIAIIIIVPILAYVIGYIYTYRLTNIYGAKVQLLLKSSDTYDYQDQIYKGLGAYGVYMDAQNQMRIMKSRDLIGEIVDRMNVSTSYFYVSRVRKVEAFKTLPFKADVKLINKFLQEKPIKVKVLDKKTFEIAIPKNEEKEVIKGSFNEPIISNDFTINLIPNYSFTDENVESIKDEDYEMIFHSKEYLIQKYRSSMDIENVEYTSILEVRVMDEIGERAKMFLDTLTSVYIDYSKKLQLEVNENTVANIEKQIDTISTFIKGKEFELLGFKDKNSILNLPKEEDDYFQRYVESTGQKRVLQQKQASLKTLEAYILNLNDENFLPPTFDALVTDVYITQTIRRVYELQLELKGRSASQVVDNENIKAKKEEINSLKKDLLVYISNLESAVDKEIATLNEYINSNKSSIKKIPVSEQGVSNIKRELDVNNKMYLFLLEKKTNSLIARAGIIPQVRLVESASQLGVVKPNKTKIVRMFFLGGIFVALFIALMRKLLFEKIQNVNELNEITSLSVIGGLPFVKEKESKLIVTKKPKAQITESFRTLRINLSYLGDFEDTSKARKISVSSFFPGEGKTFTSTNIASLLAMSDKKVVIVDFDLHKPKIHKTFDLENKKGISSFLIGNDTLDDIIHEKLYDNLDVITAGPIPPNPSEIVLKSKMTDLFAQLEERYDYIIVDTPPFGLLNDAIELVKYLDIFVVVVNTKYIKHKGVRTIESLLEKHDDIDVGMVLNGVRRSKFQYYYSKYSYKYNYNYGYNYGYGYGDAYSDYTDKD